MPRPALPGQLRNGDTVTASGVVVKLSCLDGWKGCERGVQHWGAWCGQPHVFAHRKFLDFPHQLTQFNYSFIL